MAQFHEWSEALAEELARPFPPECHKTKRQGGSEITFVGVWDYVGRLNDLVGPQGWSAGDLTTRDVGDKLLVALPLTILGVTKVNVGTEDEDKDSFGDAATNAWAQAFKRSCALFGLGTYLYNPAAREAARRGTQQAPRSDARRAAAQSERPKAERQVVKREDVTPAPPEAIREISTLVNTREVPGDLYQRITDRMADVDVKPLTLAEAQQTIKVLKRLPEVAAGV